MESSKRADLPTAYGNFNVKAFRDSDAREHIAVYKGELSKEKVPVRLHSQCLTGDTLASLKCDCRQQLINSLEHIESAGYGVVVYLQQEGRGIGLFNKINAYCLQDKGCDTVEANNRLGFPTDMRDYKAAAEILSILGVKSVALLTNNRDKIRGLEESGINVVERIPLLVKPTKHSSYYLKTKKEKMGHML